jgi:elongation factor Ts
MAISPADVKSLRDRTGAGMADCKKALEEAGGDINGAIEVLRKKGAASASKRADRSANEGVIATAVSADHKRAAIVEVNCETDFVARNEEFSSFVKKLAQAIVDGQPKNQEELNALQIDGTSVEAHFHDLLAKFSERIEIRRYEIVSTEQGYVTDYVHQGDKLAVLVELTGSGDETNGIARDIAMQIAAMNPTFVHRKEVPESVISKEKEILSDQIAAEGKKPEIAEKIVTGRLEKYFADACLLEQSFVKDSARTIQEVLRSAANDSGNEVTVSRFVRYNLGENVA